MPAQYIYNHAVGSNVDLSAQVRAYTQQATWNAEEGSVAISTITVDDEAGGLDLLGHHTFTWNETSEGSNSQIVHFGLIADTDISRGPFKVLNSRQWSVNMSDPNALLSRPIMRGSDANRPAETDVQRIQWLVGTGEMNLVSDTTYISTSGAVSMDAADYRDQTVLSIIDDCAQASGKNYWVGRFIEAPFPGFGLFYDFASSTAYSSTVRLTNVLADVDSSTTFAAFNEDLKLNRDPSRIFSGVLLPFDGGEVFVEDDSIRVQWSRRHTTAPSINVKSSAKAQARALRYMHDAATPEDRLTMSYLVPLAKVNQLKHGHRFQVKFSHLPGYEDWTWVRALKRTVKAESEEFYRVTIEATRGQGTVASCSMSLSGADVGDSGAIASTGPTSITPTTPAQTSMFLGGWFATEGTGFTGFTGGVSAPYTEVDRIDQSTTPGTHTCLATAYASTGSAFTVSGFNGSGGDPVNRAKVVTIATNATAPVQTAFQSGSGASVTFSSPTTVGNMLVMFHFTEGTGPTVNPPLILLDGVTNDGSWTQIDGTFDSGGVIGVNGFWQGIYCYCITQSFTTITTGDASFAHWASVMEIPIL